ncbi:MAG TPA: hypothetical protein PKC28_11760 [Bdellovibrionales bacterium]|nr:hypothetical protein [Bdellovibrionales bacterium]
MKKYIVALGVLVGCASAFGFTYAQLLSENDMEFQRIDNANGVALGSELKSEHPWGSYNQWQCFHMSQIELTCADYDHGTLVPSISVATEREIFLFDTHVEDRLDCEQTLSSWRRLLAGGSEACIFAAHMPDVDLDSDGDLPQSLWYINRLKGVGGYWNLFEESLEFQD